jgi:hypothetical protein
MTKLKTFLIRATSDRESVMRLPVNGIGRITTKGHKMIQDRFYEGATDTRHGLKHAICLEEYTNGHDLSKAIANYYANAI